MSAVSSVRPLVHFQMTQTILHNLCQVMSRSRPSVKAYLLQVAVRIPIGGCRPDSPHLLIVLGSSHPVDPPEGFGTLGFPGMLWVSGLHRSEVCTGSRVYLASQIRPARRATSVLAHDVFPPTHPVPPRATVCHPPWMLS